MKNKKNYSNKEALKLAMEEDKKYQFDGKSEVKKNRGKKHGKKVDSKSY